MVTSKWSGATCTATSAHLKLNTRIALEMTHLDDVKVIWRQLLGDRLPEWPGVLVLLRQQQKERKQSAPERY